MAFLPALTGTGMSALDFRDYKRGDSSKIPALRGGQRGGHLNIMIDNQ